MIVKCPEELIKVIQDYKAMVDPMLLQHAIELPYPLLVIVQENMSEVDGSTGQYNIIHSIAIKTKQDILKGIEQAKSILAILTSELDAIYSAELN